jgi:hypothetical protein
MQLLKKQGKDENLFLKDQRLQKKSNAKTWNKLCRLVQLTSIAYLSMHEHL